MNIEEVEGAGYRIGIPVPFPMKYVYCYLFPQDDHYVLIDTGMNYSKAREAWINVFNTLGIKTSQIHEVYVTHFHPDHVGLAGWLQEKTGADVFMPKVDMDMFHRVFGEGSKQAARVKHMMIENGTPPKLGNEIEKNMEQMNSNVLPLPILRTLEDRPFFANRKWEILHTPGHSDGLVSFYDPEEGLLLSSDLILEPITPNISVWPATNENPLHDYLESLRKISELHIHVALSAHGEIIYRVKERIGELIDHHEERLSMIENMACKRSAYEIAETLFKHRNLNPHQWRFAMAETIAHLYYLEDEGRVGRAKGPNGVFYYENKQHSLATDR